jgi:hypothetical protein
MYFISYFSRALALASVEGRDAFKAEPLKRGSIYGRRKMAKKFFFKWACFVGPDFVRHICRADFVGAYFNRSYISAIPHFFLLKIDKLIKISRKTIKDK